MTTPHERALYLLRALVIAKREQKMARKTRDVGIIQAADGRLARVWRDADDHITQLGNAGVAPIDPVATIKVTRTEAGLAYDVWLSNGMWDLTEPGEYPLTVAAGVNTPDGGQQK